METAPKQQQQQFEEEKKQHFGEMKYRKQMVNGHDQQQQQQQHGIHLSTSIDIYWIGSMLGKQIKHKHTHFDGGKRKKPTGETNGLWCVVI